MEKIVWLSLIKVLTIIVFVIFGFLMIFGILGGHTYGFENYTKGQAPFVGGISEFSRRIISHQDFRLVVQK
ncbi:hypothetical protein ACVQ90_00135 [Staphylococcus aureus]